jgi:hypothetical protein
LVTFSSIKRALENENEIEIKRIIIFLCVSRSYQDSSLIFEVRLGDVMDLICPFYNEQEAYVTNKFEQYDIYRVCYLFLN